MQKGKGRGKGKIPKKYKLMRFLNDEASDIFDKISALPFVDERGILLEKRGWSIKYVEAIKALGWERFCRPREEAIHSWVYEFYANGRFHKDRKAIVRDIEVDFSASAINRTFELVDHEYDLLNAAMLELKYTDIKDAICGSTDIAWMNPQKKSMKATCLTREAKVWLMFVNSSLWPTKNHCQVSMEKAMLIFSILSGAKLNVGKIISEQLTMKISNEDPKQLWFPTLITLLCKNAGVEKYDNDIVTTVKHHITKTAIFRNIKIPKEKLEDFKTPVSKEKEEPEDWELLFASAQGKQGQSSKEVEPEPTKIQIDEGVTENLEHIKLYMRYNHLYMNARYDSICRNQEVILKRAKLDPVVEVNPWKEKFDEEGYLLTSDGERLDPTEDVEENGDSEEEE